MTTYIETIPLANIAAAIDRSINPQGKQLNFAVFVFTEDGKKIRYVANAPREKVAAVVQDYVAALITQPETKQ